ncbi:MAG: DUF58 domain-containing protein [Chloroflexota bacterium]
MVEGNLNLQSNTPEQILQRLEWRVVRRLDGLLQGDYRTLFYGTGIDFADLREYQAQDDVRYIDWNVTARMDSPYVRQYVEDREITAWFLLDLSASMNFGPLDRPKGSVLNDLVATLARVLTRDGNRVGAILYKSRVELTIPPKSGRNQVLRLLRELLRETQATGTPLTSGKRPEEETQSFWRNLFSKRSESLSVNRKNQKKHGREATDLSALLNAGLNTFRRRSLVFVISDFISEPGWERPLALLARRHELVAIRLWDPQEVTLPNAGLMLVEDAETGEYFSVDTGDPGFRQRFQEAAQQRKETLALSTRRAGVDLFDISNEEDVTNAIVRIASLRKRRR